MTVTDRLHRVLAGKYLIEAFIGAGGMGLVYAASHRLTRERVAVKFLRRELLEDAESTRRFITEAQTVARLKHPNIVRLMDLDTDPEWGLYMVLELLHGESLEELLQREGSLPFEQAYSLLRPIMKALGHAHAHELIHRDVKPANIYLHREDDGTLTPKLLDFGLVRSLSIGGGLNTRTGQVMGTPGHMSPEQARGERGLSPATDIWSMGVTLYRALAGVEPFERSSRDATVLAVVSGSYVALPQRCPQLPAAARLQRVLERALQPDPAARVANMQGLIESFDAVRRGEDGAGAAAAPVALSGKLDALLHGRAAQLTLLVLLALALSVLGSLIWLRVQGRPGRRPAATAPSRAAEQALPAPFVPPAPLPPTESPPATPPAAGSGAEVLPAL